jgi:hypothetical protein
VNEHNGWVPRDFLLEPWEKEAITSPALVVEVDVVFLRIAYPRRRRYDGSIHLKNKDDRISVAYALCAN